MLSSHIQELIEIWLSFNYHNFKALNENSYESAFKCEELMDRRYEVIREINECFQETK